MGFRSEAPIMGPVMKHGSKASRPQAKGEAPLLGNQRKTSANTMRTGSLAGQPKAKLRRVPGPATVTAGAVDNRTKL